MKVKQIQISNWKSFGSNPATEVSFNDNINIFIGPNSEGKTNFTNALRMACGYSPDYGGNLYERGNKEIQVLDFNDKSEPIGITIHTDNDEPYQLTINSREAGKAIYFTNKYTDCFLPIGAKKELFNIGVILDNGEKIISKETFQTIQSVWNKIQTDAEDYFGFNLGNPPQDRKKLYADVIDKNNQRIYEAGQGNVGILYYLIELHVHLDKGKTCFLFDEPDTHMHPKMQRAFLNYITDISSENNLQFFISTHSSVLIDQSILSDKADVFQIKKRNDKSEVINITENNESIRELVYNQLGYSPSDLLLAKTLIWVEGPSDIIYLKHWISVREPELKEGKDYSFVFYGGSSVVHLSFDENVNIDSLIKLCSINANSAIVIDKDGPEKSDKKEEIKKRIDSNGFVWITEGREIENFIERKIFETAVKKVHKELGEEYSIPSDEDSFHQRTILRQTPKNYINKVAVANEIIKTRQTDFSVCNLGNQLDELIKWIKKKAGNN